ncbi:MULTISPECIES: hypothetical protein [unclassified Streptomyces]|uniref:hypothetical protein n=1 Tax=unclassified Streptomyces TaxID=2593676 RepID=UPI002E37F496|nr:hypothetical protein [Streptomyces sp. NBC_01268]
MVKAPLTYLPQITNSAEVAGGTPDPGPGNDAGGTPDPGPGNDAGGTPDPGPGNDAVTIDTRPNRPTPRG